MLKLPQAEKGTPPATAVRKTRSLLLAGRSSGYRSRTAMLDPIRTLERGVYHARYLDPKTRRPIVLLIGRDHTLLHELPWDLGETEAAAAERAWALLDLIDPIPT